METRNPPSFKFILSPKISPIAEHQTRITPSHQKFPIWEWDLGIGLWWGIDEEGDEAHIDKEIGSHAAKNCVFCCANASVDICIWHQERHRDREAQAIALGEALLRGIHIKRVRQCSRSDALEMQIVSNLLFYSKLTQNKAVQSDWRACRRGSPQFDEEGRFGRRCLYHTDCCRLPLLRLQEQQEDGDSEEELI